MVSRKRVRDEMEAPPAVEEPTTLHKLRNMWQFANLAQYLFLFLDALKLDKDFDIEDLEAECLKPQPSEKLKEIGLALLKHVSSHKGLTLDIFDEYTRRQFVAKAPLRNPFGTDEEPNKFDEFDIFTKIRVLQQLSQWTLNNPNSIRDKLNLTELEQVSWRVEPVGWDREGRTLFVLDDNRLYRRTDPPPPPPPKAKPKAKAKKSKATRGSKRRKTATPPPEDVAEDGETEVDGAVEPEDDRLGGAKWECLCITLEDYQSFMSQIRRSKDANEKDLYQDLENDVLPIIQQQAEERAKKEARRQKEAENLLKLATAKRSSRISSRQQKQKEAEEAEEAERKRLADLAQAQAEQEKQHKLEHDRDSRRMTREQRVREREAKRILEEEGLRKLKEDEEKLSTNDAQARISERHLRAEMKRREEELQKLKEEDEWVFDCEKCGVHGDSYDDGTHIIACDKCNVWQHSKCHAISSTQADREDFHFVCTYCKHKEEEAKQPKLPPLKLHLTSASPSQANGTNSNPPPRTLTTVHIPAPSNPLPSNPLPAQPPHSLLNGPVLSPGGQVGAPRATHRPEALFGAYRPQINGSSPAPSHPSSPTRPTTSSFVGNGFPPSSPPQYRSSQPPTSPFTNAGSAAYQFKIAQNTPHGGSSLSRPTSSAGIGASFPSPVKRSPVPSPKPANGFPSGYNFTNSPHSSFPPNPTQRLSFSPTKHSSPPPPFSHMSSPAPVPAPVLQNTAQMLPAPIPAPEKHDAARPISSQEFSHTQVFPPMQALSPDNKRQIMSPPQKKSSPSPERPQFAPVSGNGFGSGNQ